MIFPPFLEFRWNSPNKEWTLDSKTWWYRLDHLFLVLGVNVHGKLAAWGLELFEGIVYFLLWGMSIFSTHEQIEFLKSNYSNYGLVFTLAPLFACIVISILNDINITEFNVADEVFLLHVGDFHGSICFSEGFLDIHIYVTCPQMFPKRSKKPRTKQSFSCFIGYWP